MNRLFTITLAVLTATPVFGIQQIHTGINPLEVGRHFYQTQEWAKALAGSFGVNPGVEPGLPDNDKEREALGKIRVLLQQGTDQDLVEALRVLETLFREQQAATAKTAPMMYQIAGTLALRLAEVTQDEAGKTRYQNLAENYLKRAIDPNTGFPNFLRAHKNLANLFFRNDRTNEALVHFVRAVELGDREAPTYGLMGAIYLEQNKFISAESALRQALMVNPNINEFKQLLGQVLLNQERYLEAKEIFSELLMVRPNEVNFWMAQTNCYIGLEMIEEATTNLEIVRLMGRAEAPSLMLLGDVYINREMVIEAADAYMEAIEKDPSDTNLRNFMRAAETLNNYAAYNESMAVLDAIDANFTDLSDEIEIDLLSLRSEVNISLGKGEEAARNLESLLRRDPFHGRALLSLARYYSEMETPQDMDEDDVRAERRRNQQRAILYYERAQSLDDDRVRVNAYIGEAQLRVQRDELARAADLLQEAQRIRFQDNIRAYLEQIEAALRSRRRG